MASSLSTTPVEDSIRNKLNELLQPSTLKITNDSWQHRHHAAMRESGGGNGETHFSIEVVSDAFKGKRMMQRHRMIYGALNEEFNSLGLHALSLTTRTPEEATQTQQ
ncbi:hypothetical protein FRC03_004906 [Tulasnella sp. 419]|nr:hypothetical protein FRC02_010572 [Tulasnella sp. 418]KAG8961839.1 hypothetical protein FRC03_004906 [Tulasnella sp. 419]